MAIGSSTSELRITGWNSRGFWVAKPYLVHLMQNADILAISVKLYPHELYHLNSLSNDFISWGKSSYDLELRNYGRVPDHSGVALLFRKSIAGHAQPLTNLGSDRICVIRIHAPGRQCIHVVAVYLPQANCRISDYQTQLDILENTVTDCMQSGQVIIIGDWNAHYGQEWGSRWIGRTTANGLKTRPFLERCSLQFADRDTNTSGPMYTYCGENGGISYIDHCAITTDLQPSVKRCAVSPNKAKNTSDHLLVSISLNIENTCAPP